MELFTRNNYFISKISLVFLSLLSAFFVYNFDLGSNETIIQFEYETSEDGISQVFWSREGKRFTQNQSVTFRFDENIRFYAVKIPLPMRSITALRYDPRNDTKTLAIKSIVIKEGKAKPQRFHGAEELLQLLQPVNGLVFLDVKIPDKIICIPQTEDPQIIFNVDSFQGKATNSWYLFNFLLPFFGFLVFFFLVNANKRRICNIISERFSFSKSLAIIEITCSCVVLVITALYLWSWIEVMSASSLWTDEIYTIENFSSKGILTSFTDYHAPNNHIFFNAVNSIIPIGNIYDPLRARSVSFIAVIFGLTFSVYFFFRRKWYLGGCLIALSITYSWNHLTLMLEARGYGIVAACGLIQACATYAYLAEKKRRYLAGTIASGVAGTLTVPTYGFFALPLLSLLAMSRRNREVLFGIIIGLTIVGLVYMPLASQIVAINSRYSGKWGAEFADLSSVFSIYRNYLITQAPYSLLWGLIILLSSVLIVPWGNISYLSKIRHLRIISLSIFIFFGVCLYLETPALRTAAFVVLPTICVISILFSVFLSHDKCSILRVSILVLLSIFLYGNYSYKQRVFERYYWPKENWKDSANFIHQIFPSSEILIYNNFRTKYLKKYLSDKYILAEEFSENLLKNGELVVVDSHPWKDVRFQVSDFSNESKTYNFLQSRAGYQSVSWVFSKAIIDDAVLLYDNHFCSSSREKIAIDRFNECVNYIDEQIFEIVLNNNRNTYSLNIDFTGINKRQISGIYGLKNGSWMAFDLSDIEFYYNESRAWKRHRFLFDATLSIKLDGKEYDCIKVAVSPLAINSMPYRINLLWGYTGK